MALHGPRRMGKGSVWQVRDTPYPDVEPDVFVKGKIARAPNVQQIKKKKDRIEVERNDVIVLWLAKECGQTFVKWK